MGKRIESNRPPDGSREYAKRETESDKVWKEWMRSGETDGSMLRESRHLAAVANSLFRGRLNESNTGLRGRHKELFITDFFSGGCKISYGCGC